MSREEFMAMVNRLAKAEIDTNTEAWGA
jgi:hypothetical protein